MSVTGLEKSVDVVVAGLGGLGPLPSHRVYFLDDFLDMSLVDLVLLNGAFLQIFPHSAKEHLVSHLSSYFVFS